MQSRLAAAGGKSEKVLGRGGGAGWRCGDISAGNSLAKKPDKSPGPSSCLSPHTSHLRPLRGSDPPNPFTRIAEIPTNRARVKWAARGVALLWED